MYGEVAAGAENDLQQVASIARQMVVRWGMSPKLGPLSYAGDDGQPLAQRPFSEETAALIDQEAKRIVEECRSRPNACWSRTARGLRACRPHCSEESLDEREIPQVTGLKPHGVVNPAPRVAQATVG